MSDQTRAEWRLVPVIEPMEYRRRNVYEHSPLDIYRYGEYPRDISPIGAHQPRVSRVLRAVSGRIDDAATKQGRE